MDSLFWNNLIQGVITITAHFMTLCIISNFLYQRSQNKLTSSVEISPSMIFYFSMQILTSTVTILYMGYYFVEVFKWTSGYNAYAWFYIYTTQKLFFIFLPLAVFSIGLDRCVCVLAPMKYKRSLIPVAITLLACGGVLAFTLVFIAPQQYPICPHFGCMRYDGSGLYISLRYGTSALILMSCLVLLGGIYKKANVHLARNLTGKSNKIILVTLLTTFTLDFLPHVAIAILGEILKINVAYVAGPVSSTIGSIEALICAILYHKVFKPPAPKAPIFVSLITPNF